MEQRGTLKSWNDQKGFGFIVPDQGGSDVFAPISAMRGDCRPAVGDRILYVAGRDGQGRLRAEHLRLDAPMMLDRPAIRRRPQLLRETPEVGRIDKKNTAKTMQPVRSAPVRQLRIKLLAFLTLCTLPLGGSLKVLLDQHVLIPLLAYVLASVLSFLLYWHDKQSALKGRWRTRENILHLCELAGGWPGALLAQQVFRHKTRKVAYQVLFWGIVLLHQVFWIDYFYLGQMFGSRFMQLILSQAG